MVCTMTCTMTCTMACTTVRTMLRSDPSPPGRGVYNDGQMTQGPIYSILAVDQGRAVLSAGRDGVIARFDRDTGRQLTNYEVRMR